MLLVLTLVTGVAYPLLVTGIAQLVFPNQANGSLIYQNGKPVGSALIGQPFNPALLQAVQARVQALRQADSSNTQPIPVDLVTASGSGLDPHISPAAAFYQVPRVARARNVEESAVRRLVEKHIEGRQLGFLGEPRVNVLKLNLALEAPLQND
jgi:K+-transporting ATPase ATPase C chain